MTENNDAGGLPIPRFLRRPMPAKAALEPQPFEIPQPPPAAATPWRSPDDRFPSVFRIYFHDEAPTIGCGWRVVIAKLGRKWVYVKPFARPDHFARTKLRRDLWDELVRGTEQHNRRCDAGPVRLDAGAPCAADDVDPEPLGGPLPAAKVRRARMAAETSGEGATETPAKAAAPPRAPTRGHWAGAAEAAAQGKLPEPPDFTAETHRRFRPRLAEVVALAQAGNLAGLRALDIKPVSSSPKAIIRYRDLCILALETASKK